MDARYLKFGNAGKWQRRLQRLFELASVVGGHARRFRDTFAVELLLAGVPLDRYLCFLGIEAFELQNVTTLPGRDRVRNKSKRI